MKSDIDKRYGERVVRPGGFIRFFGDTYWHHNLERLAGTPVMVKGYGYSAIDVFFIRRRFGGWARGSFICMTEARL